MQARSSDGGVQTQSTTPRAVAYLYPWDLSGDPQAVARLRSAGLQYVAVAAAYHAVRAATPHHPSRRFVVAETAALYRPVRTAVWEGRPLVPLTAPWAGAEDSFGDAVRLLDAEGIAVSAWIVLTHNSALGRARRDLVVRNCFGDIYDHALCPANAPVREYSALLAAEVVRDLPLEAVSLEAWGQLGSAHAGSHDKTGAAYGATAQQVISICCCDACRHSWGSRGLDPDATERALQSAYETAQRSRLQLPEVLGEERCAALLASRQESCDALLEEVLDAIGHGRQVLRVALHASGDPWATGASPGLTPRSSGMVDAVLVPVAPKAPRPDEEIAAMRYTVPVGCDVAAYLNLLGLAGPDDLGGHERPLLSAGADELHLYHFGLASQDQLPLFSRLAQPTR